MKHIAIVTPCILPVPATEGGAVEELITRIVNENELNDDFMIDLFSVMDDTELHDYLNNTRVIGIEYKKNQKFADRVLDKLQRTIAVEQSYRLFDKDIERAFEERLSSLDEPYYAVIVENQISIAKRIAAVCRGSYESPIFFHMHNDVDIYRSPKGIRDLTALGIQFIAVSNYIKQQILCCDADAMVHLLYNGTKLKDRDVDAKVDEHKTTGKEIRFLYAGRVIPEKGVLELVEAFAKFTGMVDVNDRTNYRLDVIGFSCNATKYENKVEAQAGKISDRISCKKRVSTADMDRMYNEYDIVVMPTMNEEPFGLVALETMSKGIPLIVTNSGALPEVVGDGAVIVSRSSNFTDDLAEAMLRLAKSKTAREELGKRAYERSREVSAFDIKNYYPNFIKIIDKKIDDDKISIVVPVYNVSDYLERCLRSLLGQTYTNIEVLLIDDGSTDGSGKLCDGFAQVDSRIRVIHQRNMGLSGARNMGLDNSTGKYVFFCDSDDFLQKDTLAYMHEKLCRDNADIVACGFSYVWDDYTEMGREEVFTNCKPGTWSGKEASVQMMRSNNICTVVWNKLYKRELFDGVRFPVGVLHEDEATTYKLLYKAKLVSYTSKTFYKYYQRASGIMGFGIIRRYEDIITALKDRISFYEKNGDMRLAQHAMISLLEQIKYCYRNVEDGQDKKRLTSLYDESVSMRKLPGVLGWKKKLSLWLWKYIRY